MRGDLGITYDVDVVRLIGEFEKKGLYVGSVVITQFAGQNGAVQFREKLEKRGIKVYQHYRLEGIVRYSTDRQRDGFGKMIILRRQDRLWLLLRRGLEAEKWQPVFHSFIMKTFAEPKPAMRSSRHSQSGIFR